MEDSRDSYSRRKRAEGDRVKAVRDALGLKQPEFAVRLTEEAQRRGLTWVRYDFSIISKLENGSRRLSLDDVLVLSCVDREERGMLWIGWGDDAKPKLVAKPVRGRVVPPPTRRRQTGEGA